MQISESKKEKISEQILSFLYSSYPKPVFTSHIAMEIARDEEFVKNLLHSIKGKNLISEVKKNSAGAKYLRRTRWKLNDNVYKKYASISKGIDNN